MKENKSVEAPAICFYEDENGSRVHFQFSDKAQAVVISLDEIKQLREENERLKNEIRAINSHDSSKLLNAQYEVALKKVVNLQTENERLKTENKRLEDYNDSLIVSWREHVAQIKQLKAQLQQKNPEPTEPDNDTIIKGLSPFKRFLKSLFPSWFDE